MWPAPSGAGHIRASCDVPVQRSVLVVGVLQVLAARRRRDFVMAALLARVEPDPGRPSAVAVAGRGGVVLHQLTLARTVGKESVAGEVVNRPAEVNERPLAVAVVEQANL